MGDRVPRTPPARGASPRSRWWCGQAVLTAVEEAPLVHGPEGLRPASASLGTPDVDSLHVPKQRDELGVGDFDPSDQVLCPFDLVSF